MPRELPTPITCLITSGATTSATTPASREFRDLVALVRRAADAGVTLVQLREKDLSARTLFDLASLASASTRGGATRVLVNDRADVARAAGCDGVHLTTRSLEPPAVRRAFGEDFLVGVSTHTHEEARAARDGGADFVLYGPVFDTPSKRAYGPPAGVESLRELARSLSPFPVVALGGLAESNLREVSESGACGVAGISLFAGGQNLAATLHLIEDLWTQRGGRVRGRP